MTKHKVSRIVFNKRAKTIQFWIAVSPWMRQYPLTTRNQLRIECVLSAFDWHASGFQLLTIYTRRNSL